MAMTPSYTGRFAPSPTGPLHFGSLVAALASFLDAKAHGGSWLVRIEDVDETRCRPGFADDILRTLTAFGLRWDGEVLLQSSQKARYDQALARLRPHTYTCTCSRKEIADSALDGLDGPVYPGTCRERAWIANAAVRVRTTATPITFTDRVQGRVTQTIETEVGDFIVKRRDGLFAYQLAVVVDDAAQGVTHVVRGADLLDSAARQIYLQTLLGASTPHYLHIPVAANSAGQKLSKQTLAPGIATQDVLQLTRAALRFLGQPSAPAADLSALLDFATRHWCAQNIPRVRSIAG
jgi:glutamyl-Q tRNA(Asp) synthetase